MAPHSSSSSSISTVTLKPFDQANSGFEAYPTLKIFIQSGLSLLGFLGLIILLA